jgi:hypothetical protein
MSKLRAVVMAAVMAITLAVGPLGVAHAAAAQETVETFVAVGTWSVGACGFSCPIAGNSISCLESEVGSDGPANLGCHVNFRGAINPFLFSSPACGVALGGWLGGVDVDVYDASDDESLTRSASVVGASAVAQGLGVTGVGPDDVIAGELDAVYPPACPTSALIQTFTLTVTLTSP